jgi:hypothetical protein
MPYRLRPRDLDGAWNDLAHRIVHVDSERSLGMAELDDPDRLAAIGPTYCEPGDDAVLDELLRRAARMADVPTALVSIVGAHTQVFRARYGLTPGLAVACGTSRSSSFCQLVVRSEEVVVIHDAASDARVPRDLVDQFGVRAYAGVPIRRGGFVIGSFCVLDVIPRRFSTEVLNDLRELAAAAGARLAQLSADAERKRAASRDVTGPSLRDRADALLAAVGLVAPVARRSGGLGMRDITPAALSTIRASLDEALQLHRVVVREARDIEAIASGYDRAGHATIRRSVDRITRTVDEMGVMTRVAEAFVHGDMAASDAARALSVARDVFGAADALGAAATSLVDALDAVGGGPS